MQWSFDRLNLEGEDIREDLQSLDLDLFSKLTVGDFACGWGYTTLSLMLELHDAECIGVDQFKKNLVLDVPSLDEVQRQFDEVKNNVLSQVNLKQEGGIKNDVYQLFNNGRFPKFQIADIVKGRNLPSGLDFVYCKKLLQNVFEGGYNISPNGDEGVQLAIENITKTVKQGGLVCIVEPAGKNFMTFLESSGLELVRCCRINRSDINGETRVSLYKAQYLVYIYAKP